MKIEARDVFIDGDHLSKILDIEVDEQYRPLDVRLYFVPVVGKVVYVSEETIKLDNEGRGSYAVPGDVLNGVGWFGAQIVCTEGTNEVAKSLAYAFECHEKIDDSHASVPSGKVITLAEMWELLSNLTASEVGYADTQGFGLDNVQSAIDYALIHGGGGGSATPTFILEWHDGTDQGGTVHPTEEEKAANIAVINSFRNLPAGSYRVLLNVNGNIIECSNISTSGTVSLLFDSYYDDDVQRLYSISYVPGRNRYSQDLAILPKDTWEQRGAASASMRAIEDYVTSRIGTTGNLVLDSYAAAADVEAIESTIPSAASAQNQLADKAYVSDQMSSKQDVLEAGPGIDITNNVISATGGGGGTLPVYYLHWYINPTQSQIEDNIAVINQIRNATFGAYRVYCIYNNSKMEVSETVLKDTSIALHFICNDDPEIQLVYKISLNWLYSEPRYSQQITSFPEWDFDETSLGAGSMMGTAQYVNDKIYEYAAPKEEVDTIKSKIPSAASAQNQLADKTYVSGQMSSKQDVLTEGQGIDISNGVISAKDIPYSALSQNVKNSLDLAENSIQEINEGNGITIGVHNTINVSGDLRTKIASIDDKQNIPSQVTTGTSITLADNTEYRLDNVTTLTLAYPSGNFECWLKISTASSGTPSITFPQSASYIGSVPTFGNDETWEISIKDGVIVALKVEASS